MKKFSTELIQNPLERFLMKPSSDFTRDDLIRFISENGIKMFNFRYVGGDGRIKTLNFPVSSRKYLDMVLSAGERADGSSLFSHIETGSSDLYVVPRFKTAFVNPFSEIPTLDIFCSYFNKDGVPYDGAPENIMLKAAASFNGVTGMNFEAMGELEYYVISQKNDLYPGTNQKGYHESPPFARWEDLRCEALYMLSQCFTDIKYGHSEVGNFSTATHDYTQNEIEFLPTDLEEAARQMVMSKWVLRMLGYKYGVGITFAPKISVGKAGSGMHFHTRIVKDGKNMMVDNNGKLNDTAKKAIAGYLSLAQSLTAFGNTNPTSYFRLVPHQEAPTNICWGDRNRSVLVRVPLGWVGASDMIKAVNPLEKENTASFFEKQTVEMRSPDGSADVYLFLAGLAVAARHGFEMKDALAFAEKTYVNVNIFHDTHKHKCDELEKLPTSCWESAECLEKHADIYKQHQVFSQSIIDGTVKNLRSFNDKNLRTDIKNDKELMDIVNSFIHCG